MNNRARLSGRAIGPVPKTPEGGSVGQKEERKKDL